MAIPDDKVDMIIECLSEIEFSIKRIVQVIYTILASLVLLMVLRLVFY